MSLSTLIALAAAAFSASSVWAEDVYIPVGEARAKKVAVAFPDPKGDGTHQKTISDTVSDDLTFMGSFVLLNKSGFGALGKEAGIAPNTFKLDEWSGVGAELLLKTSLSLEKGKVVLEAHAYDVPRSREILSKKYLGDSGQVRALAHTFANDLVKAYTGLPGVFLTRIAMSCDRTGKKEIYTMDFDGSNVRQITHHGSIAFSPAWSPDGTRVAYSVFTRGRDNIKNIDLYEFDFRSQTVKLLSNRRGINSGAAYAPGGGKIALTMSFKGNPEIFVLDPQKSTLVQMTKSFGMDVDPTWSSDGHQIAFVSSRSGQPMIYSMSSDPTKSDATTKRLTFAGRYNATPSWSPAGHKIAFASWIDSGFDVFMMNPDGTKLERLTRAQGSNEDPQFSPDGNFVVFSSNRAGKKNIYVMNLDGTFIKRLTFGLGNCVAPKWSPVP